MREDHRQGSVSLVSELKLVDNQDALAAEPLVRITLLSRQKVLGVVRKAPLKRVSDAIDDLGVGDASRDVRRSIRISRIDGVAGRAVSPDLSGSRELIRVGMEPAVQTRTDHVMRLLARRHLDLGMRVEIVVQARRAAFRRADHEERRKDESRRRYSHSIVAGGFDEMSSATRFTPGTSLMMRFEIRSRSSYGRRAQSAVIASSEVTARITIGYA